MMRSPQPGSMRFMRSTDCLLKARARVSSSDIDRFPVICGTAESIRCRNAFGHELCTGQCFFNPYPTGSKNAGAISPDPPIAMPQTPR